MDRVDHVLCTPPWSPVMATATPSEIRDQLSGYQENLEQEQKAIVHISKEKMVPQTPFVFLFAENFESILAKHKLTGFCCRLIMKMISRMQYGNMVSLTQTALASEMGVKKQQVNEAYSRLLEVGILVKDQHGAIFFNLELVLKGKFSNLQSEFKHQAEVSRSNNELMKHDTMPPFDFKPKKRGRPSKQQTLLKEAAAAAIEEVEMV